MMRLGAKQIYLGVFLALVAVLAAGCSSKRAASTPADTAVVEETRNEQTAGADPTVSVPTETNTVPAAPDPTTTTAAPEAMDMATHKPTAPNQVIGEDEAKKLMSDLLFNGEAAPMALQRILEAEDVRFTAVFLELLRAHQIGLVRSGLSGVDFLSAIEVLHGEAPGDDWFELVEWYGQTDSEPPPGFVSWKGRIMSLIDPRFSIFLQDDHPSNIRVEEIQWGGVPVDGIPALDQPSMLAAEEADYLEPQNIVFGIELNGETRAYPKRILDWHEMANDVVGGVPVSLSYCTLCGAAVAFDGRASDGKVYNFGSSGLLFRSNKLMYDRQTNTLWNQLTGAPVLGELVESGLQLEILPVVLTTWEAWQSAHPDTLVVDIDTGYDRDYRPGAAYGDYFAYEDTMFPVWQRIDLLDAKDQIYAVRINDVPRAYPLDILAEEKVVNDRVGEQPVVLVAPGEILQIEGDSLRTGEITYEAGSAVRAYDRGPYLFAPGPDAEILLDDAGRSWQLTEAALIGPDGEKLERLGGHLAYWFGWYAFFPNTSVYGQ